MLLLFYFNYEEKYYIYYFSKYSVDAVKNKKKNKWHVQLKLVKFLLLYLLLLLLLVNCQFQKVAYVMLV